MAASFLESRAETRNAKVAAVTFAGAAFMTLLLSHFSATLVPLRLIALAAAAFAAWAFCDEMGLKKPLNRAGILFFAIATVTKVQILLGVEAKFAGRYYVLYAAFLMLAMAFWSIAFLHRRRELKIVGAVGGLAALAPIVMIIAGHLALGVGTSVGVGSLLAATKGGAPTDLSFVTTVERIFGLWGYGAAWLLWRGYIADKPAVAAT